MSVRAMPVFGQAETSIFEDVSRMARRHAAINLGQGFPEDGFPNDVIEYAARALTEHSNQYPPMLGLPELRRAVASHDRRFYGIDVDWETCTLVTAGATEALAATLLALVEPGDEVVLIEPLYDDYAPIIIRAGGTIRLVQLQPPGWTLPREALRAAFSSRTKVVVVNSPHNPTGKVFTRGELDYLAQLIQEYDCYALCDEVYEHLVYDGHTHIPLMTLPNMASRCVRVGSAGKTFSLTGWRIGYITAEATLLACVARAHQHLTFATPPNLQYAVAFGLNKSVDFFDGVQRHMQAKRERFFRGCTAMGLSGPLTEGTYFATLHVPNGMPDGDFCQRLVAQAHVAALPLSAFYRSAAPQPMVRFCFAKRDEVLDEALARLRLFIG